MGYSCLRIDPTAGIPRRDGIINHAAGLELSGDNPDSGHEFFRAGCIITVTRNFFKLIDKYSRKVK
jgi:hypothetical protein